MPLTAKQVSAAQPKDKPYKLTDANRLYLYVAVSGTKSWRCNYLDGGKDKTKTFGQYPAMSLADARMAHVKFRDLQDAPASDTAPTFKKVAEAWLKIKLPTLSNPKHQLQVAKTIEQYVYPHIGGKPIDQIKRQELVNIVRLVAESGVVETAHRVAGRINMVFDYAQDAGLIEAHAANDLTRVIEQRKRKKPMPSIPPGEAPALFAAIATYDEPVTELGLMLMAHIFVRTKELRVAKWTEINYDDAVWVVPEDRMKLRKPHVVPLSKQAIKLLRELAVLAGESPYILNSPLRFGHPVSENTLLFALYRLGYRGRMTVHGFRALASSVLNEKTDFDADAIERQLSHKEKDEVRASYNRAEYLDQRRIMMQWWSDWIDSQCVHQDRIDASE
ncbi:tyrosine-type recombinase/integrase [Collimonas humicola]|uniref:tyrosine-type recombinase/integrase n=1 Tax=Collimonas humicola TaxID=2825886 RepID=UPI001B8B0A2C|nr:integrase arm-type DNA-binding domain-containing protein [Collimonas humicola]